MPPEPWNQIVNIQWVNTNAIEAVDAFILKLKTAETSLENIRRDTAAVGGGGGAATPATQAPLWYTKAPDWYSAPFAPDWWKTPPPWYATVASGASGANVTPTNAPTPQPGAPAQAAPPTSAIQGGYIPVSNNPNQFYNPATGQLVTTGGLTPPMVMTQAQIAASPGVAAAAQPAQYTQLPMFPGGFPGMGPGSMGMYQTGQAPSLFPGYARTARSIEENVAETLEQYPPLSDNQRFAWQARIAAQREREITSWQQAQMRSTEGLASQRTEEERINTLIPTTGVSGRAGMAYILRENQERLRAQRESLISPEGQITDLAKFNQVNAQLDAINNQYKQVTNTATLWNNQLARHAVWIAQGIALAAVFTAITTAVAGTVQEYVKLSDVSGQLRAIGAGGDVTGNLLTQYALASRYGIGTQEAGQAALMSQRLSLTSEMQQQGRELATVYGVKEYNNILTELYQTKRNLNAVGLEEYRVMDTLATIYSRVSGSVELAFDSIQAALQIYKQLQVTPEIAGVAIARAAQSMEVSPEVAAQTVQRLIRNVQKPTTQAQLETYGIDTTRSMPETLRQIIPVMRQLQDEASSGTEETEKRFVDFMNIITNAGIQSAGQAQRMAQTLQALNEMFDQSDQPLENWGRVVSNVMDTATNKVNRLKSAWELMLASLTTSPPVGGWLDAWTSKFEAFGNAISAGSMLGQIPREDIAKYIRQYEEEKPMGARVSEQWEKGGGIFGAFDIGLRGMSDLVKYIVDKWLESQQAQSNTTMLPDTIAAAIARTIGSGGGGLSLFSQMQPIPGGAGYLARFQELYQQQVSYLTKTGFDINAEIAAVQTPTALTDLRGNVVMGPDGKPVMGRYSQTAMQRAMTQMQQEQGYNIVQPIPGASGAEVQRQVDAARSRLEQIEIGGRRVYAEARAADPTMVKTFEYWDEATRTWHEIKATQEEMNEATKEIQKNTSIKGVFNVPEGGRVPWAAIMEGYTDPSRLPRQSTNFMDSALGPLIRALANFVPGQGQMPMTIPPTGPFPQAAPWQQGPAGDLWSQLFGQSSWTPQLGALQQTRVGPLALGPQPQGRVSPTLYGLQVPVETPGYETRHPTQTEGGPSWLQRFGGWLWDQMKPQPFPKTQPEPSQNFGDWLLERIMPQAFPQAHPQARPESYRNQWPDETVRRHGFDKATSTTQSDTIQVNNNISTPVNLTIPVNVMIAGEQVMRYVQTRMYEQTSTQSRTSISGRRSFMP